MKLKFTDGASVQAARSETDVEEQVRNELAGRNPDKLIFHVVSTDVGDFMCTPDRSEPDTFKVDTCFHEKVMKLNEGPFAGYTVKMPVADGEDE